MTRPLIVLPPALEPLTKQQRWVIWRRETSKTGKVTKVPYRGDTPRKRASSKDESSWCTLPVAMLAYTEGRCDGIAFVLTGSDFSAVDADDCRTATGELHPWVLDKIERSASYAEITPSKAGIRIVGIGTGEHVHRKFDVPDGNGASVELYRKATRVITITGEQIGTVTELANIDASIDAMLAELEALKRRKRKQANGSGQRRRREHDLESLIKEGCGNDFGGDRSRAVWYVINQLLKQGKTADEVVAVLLDRGNGISAHI
jgi:hypothetical protein